MILVGIQHCHHSSGAGPDLSPKAGASLRLTRRTDLLCSSGLGSAPQSTISPQ
uniref:Uncharacterized protein n=1 Tax=Arundo donax TaxID=35708 RepID=A0A0A9CPE4_ARUDO